MTDLKKEDLPQTIKEMTELLCKQFGNVPFFLCICDSTGDNNAQARSQWLQDPNQITRVLSAIINQNAVQIINQNAEMLRLIAKQQMASVIEEAKQATKN